MEVLKHVEYIKIKCEIRGFNKISDLLSLTEELPTFAMLRIDTRLVTKENKKGIGADLFLVSLELDRPHDSVFYKLKEIVYKSSDRAHQIFAESYAENKDLWVNFIREVAKNPELKDKAGYSFKIMKDAWEDGTLDLVEHDTDHHFDKILYILEGNAKEVRKQLTEKGAYTL